MREQKPKAEKFNFEKMKAAAMHDDPSVRKSMFIEYFERFDEFPSYLFDNEHEMDSRLYRTMQDIQNDPKTSRAMQKGIEALMQRLPNPPETAPERQRLPHGNL